MGALPETKETKPDFRPAEEYDDVKVPVAFDARTAWPECKMIGHIRDQATCGSCWAFGGVEAMSDRVCIASNGTAQVELSTEDMLSCCGFSCGSGCNGGYPSAAWRFFKKHGLTTEDKYPYAFPPCEVHLCFLCAGPMQSQVALQRLRALLTCPHAAGCAKCALRGTDEPHAITTCDRSSSTTSTPRTTSRAAPRSPRPRCVRVLACMRAYVCALRVDAWSIEHTHTHTHSATRQPSRAKSTTASQSTR